MHYLRETLKFLGLIILFAITTQACFLDDDDEDQTQIDAPDLGTGTLNFIFAYEYDGITPSFRYQPNQSSPTIFFNPNDVDIFSSTTNNQHWNIILRNVNVVDALDDENYEIVDIGLYHQNEQNNFVKEEEFEAEYFNVSAQNAVFVVDNSTSIADVAVQSKQTIDDMMVHLMTRFPELYFGWVAFDPDVAITNLSPMTSAYQNTLHTSISNMTLHNQTPLFDAIDRGIDMLVNTSNSKPKALYIFTDGKDNSSGGQAEALELQDKMRTSGISTFVVGLRFGGNEIDNDILTILSNNVGLKRIIDTNDDIGNAMEAFVDHIGLTYEVLHTRVKSTTSKPEYYDLRLNVK
jgi:hypothetical protein